jgi:hypothetical protein
MQVYLLTDRNSGEATLVDMDTVERLLGIELGYVEWCIDIDGEFENGGWKVEIVGREGTQRAARRPSLQMRTYPIKDLMPAVEIQFQPDEVRRWSCL